MNRLKFFPMATIVLSVVSTVLLVLVVIGQGILGPIYSMQEMPFVIPYSYLIISLLSLIITILCMRTVLKSESVNGAQTAAVIYVVCMIVFSLLGFVLSRIEIQMYAFKDAYFLSAYSVVNGTISLISAPLASLARLSGCVVLGMAIAYKKIKTDIYM